MNGPLQSSLFGLFGGSKTYWNGQYFDEQFNNLNLSFSPAPNLQLGINIRVEDVVDFANTRLGHSDESGQRFAISSAVISSLILSTPFRILTSTAAACLLLN